MIIQVHKDHGSLNFQADGAKAGFSLTERSGRFKVGRSMQGTVQIEGPAVIAALQDFFVSFRLFFQLGGTVVYGKIKVQRIAAENCRVPPPFRGHEKGTCQHHSTKITLGFGENLRE